MPEPKRPLKVFLCHASTDKPKVRELYRYLKKRGIQPWFDEEDLVGGQDWQVEIPKALATSDAIIICLTKNSIDREGYIQKEIKFALDKALEMPEGRIFLIPVKFEECEVPFTLSRYQWVDLTVESGYAKMMKALKFRAAQLERSTVEISKKDVLEENIAREKAEKEATEKAWLEAEELARQKTAKEKAEREATERAEKERKAKELREQQVREAREKEKRESEKKEHKPVAVKPKSSGQLAYWAGGFIVLVLGIIFLSSLPPSSTSQPTPENTQTQVIVTLTQDTAEATAKSTSTPVVTQIPKSLYTEITDAKGVRMMLVPAGEFVMGNDSGSDDEKPAHTVYLDEYYIDKYEVTNALYKTCVNAGVCDLPNNLSSSTRSDYYENLKYNNYPVVYINWTQAKTYCEWRGAYLPTEAQWEKAARGKDERNYPWGEDVTCADANLCEDDTSEVGVYKKNISSYGVYDMVGNVFEMTADWYGIRYYPVSPVTNPTGPSIGDRYVVRGGAYELGEANLGFARLTMRWSSTTTDATAYNGFRCAKDANP